MGDHTLAKEEHRAVLALLGAQVKEKPTRGGANGERDVYIDTMVNMHRQVNIFCCLYAGMYTHRLVCLMFLHAFTVIVLVHERIFNT